MTTHEAIAILKKKISLDDLVVSSLGRTAEETFLQISNRERILFLDCMGAVTGVAIGIGLGCPQRHVFAFDTDGSIMYDLTIFHTLASLGNKITNLTVIIFDNELLESGGNVNSRSVYFDWSKYAESWGLKLSVLYEIEEIESLFAKRTNLSQATLIVLKVNNESSPITCQKDIDGIESKYGFKRFINTHINKGIIKPAVKN